MWRTVKGRGAAVMNSWWEYEPCWQALLLFCLLLNEKKSCQFTWHPDVRQGECQRILAAWRQPRRPPPLQQSHHLPVYLLKLPAGADPFSPFWFSSAAKTEEAALAVIFWVTHSSAFSEDHCQLNQGRHLVHFPFLMLSHMTKLADIYI